MGMIFRILISVVLGLVIGGGSALWMGGMLPGGPQIGNAIEVEEWRSDWSIGSENASPYVRARVARNGLMGLRKEEAVYFMRTVDDAGEPLREACIYRISGAGLPADWWSITLYDPASKLPMNTDERLSFDQTQAEAVFEDASAAWEVQVSANEPEELLMPWISSQAGGAFDLTLRLYRPSAALLADPASALEPPQVKRLSCDEEAN